MVRVISITLLPWRAWPALYPGKSLPTYSSFVARMQLLQFSHSATSTMRFHRVVG